jgi:hypothetical protein
MLNVLLGDVVEETTTLADHEHQTATRVVIALMHLEVFSQMCDPLRQERNLDIRRTSVSRFGGIFFNNFLFSLSVHRALPSEVVARSLSLIEQALPLSRPIKRHRTF